MRHDDGPTPDVRQTDRWLYYGVGYEVRKNTTRASARLGAHDAPGAGDTRAPSWRNSIRRIRGRRNLTKQQALYPFQRSRSALGVSRLIRFLFYRFTSTYLSTNKACSQKDGDSWRSKITFGVTPEVTKRDFKLSSAWKRQPLGTESFCFFFPPNRDISTEKTRLYSFVSDLFV